MAFTEQERKRLLSVKGVGVKVVQRLEEIGIDCFAELATYDVEEITETIASMMRNSCWKNSPQAKAAIKGAIEKAKESYAYD